jgi:transposase
MARDFRPVDRAQQFLVPPDMRDWLRPDHLVWFVIDFVAALDVSKFEARARLGGVGRRGYDPRMLLTLLMYAYATGQRSSREIERLCEVDVAFRIVCGQDVPDHTVIARFRKRHEKALADVFGQVLAVCVRQGMGQLGTIAIDGTKIAANASRGANRSESWLREQAAEILAEADRVDAAEDARHGRDRRGDELPTLFADPATRRQAIADGLADLAGEPAAGPAGRPADDAAGKPPDPPGAGGHEQASPEPGTGSASSGTPETPPAGAESADGGGAARARNKPRNKHRDAGVLELVRGLDQERAARDEPAKIRARARANDLIDRAHAHRDRVRARLEERARARAEREAATGGRRLPGTRPVPVERHIRMREAEDQLARARQALADAEHARGQDRRGELQRNLTDPASRLMHDAAGGSIQGYNAQLAVTGDHLILAVEVTQDANDQHQFAPMVTAVQTTVTRLNTQCPGRDLRIGTLLADAGYCSEENLTSAGPDRLIAVTSRRGRAPVSTTPAAKEMAARLATDEARARYRRRSATVETMNAHLKDRRGLRRFARRGLDAVRSELHFTAGVTNMLRLRTHRATHPATT